MADDRFNKSDKIHLTLSSDVWPVSFSYADIAAAPNTVAEHVAPFMAEALNKMTPDERKQLIEHLEANT